MVTIRGEQFYRMKEVCAELGLSIPTVRLLRKKGQLRSIFIGRRPYVSSTALTNFRNRLISQERATHPATQQ